MQRRSDEAMEVVGLFAIDRWYDEWDNRYLYGSIHFDHSGVEIRTAPDFAGVVADAADCHDVDEADQQGNQASNTNNSAGTGHKILEGIVAVLNIT